MFKKTISYTNLDGLPVEDTFHFALNESEITEFGLSYGGIGGDLETYFRQIMKIEDTPALISLFKDLFCRSIGVRSEDGRRFKKSQDIIDDFMETGAYSAYFMEMMTNPEKATEFFVNVVPSSMQQPMVDELAKIDFASLKDGKLPESMLNKTYTTAELIAMDDETFSRVVGNDPTKMSQNHLVAAMQRKMAPRITQ